MPSAQLFHICVNRLAYEKWSVSPKNIGTKTAAILGYPQLFSGSKRDMGGCCE